MKVRTLTAAAIIAVLIPFMIFSDLWIFPCLFAVLSALASFEIQRCIGCHTKWYAAVPSYAVSVLTVLMTRYTERFNTVALTIFSIYLFWLLCASVFSRGAFSVSDACQLTAMVIYETVGFSAVVLLRDVQHGVYVFALAFAVPWACDVFAYLCGRLLGRHKLIPSVSPKKTVEGAVGGVVFGTLTLVLYGYIVGRFFEPRPNYLALVLMGVIMTVVSQCGDLIASQLKRSYGIKDYGRIFPGHGGVMDRFDSVIPSAIFLFLLQEISGAFDIFF